MERKHGDWQSTTTWFQKLRYPMQRQVRNEIHCYLVLKSALNDANTATPGKIVVTVSDEAFALLIYENYVDKWIKAAAKEEEEDTAEAGQDNQKGCKELRAFV